MLKIFDVITELCQQEGWELTELDDGEAMVEFNEENEEEWVCYAYAREKQKQFVFYSVLNTQVSPENCLVVAEFLTRLNYGLSIGNFEMNFDTGDIRYKTSIDFDKTAPTADLLAPLVYANTTSMGKFWPVLSDVISGNLSPINAIKRVKAM